MSWTYSVKNTASCCDLQTLSLWGCFWFSEVLALRYGPSFFVLRLASFLVNNSFHSISQAIVQYVNISPKIWAWIGLFSLGLETSDSSACSFWLHGEQLSCEMTIVYLCWQLPHFSPFKRRWCLFICFPIEEKGLFLMSSVITYGGAHFFEMFWQFKCAEVSPSWLTHMLF